jgi:alpha-methylacyl-CoA racemase
MTATGTLLSAASGPLKGVRIVEFSGLGPVPFAGMLLSDMGADIVRIERPGVLALDANDVTARGRRFVTLDLKRSDDVEQARALVAQAEVLLEGFRPGVMERLGLGPEVVHASNRGLVYGRMTGWGQTGPLASSVGHDINYISITGALAAIGSADAPIPPLNLVGDYGAGALYLVSGVLAALVEARSSGQGQVVDCAMVDGALSLMSLFHGWRNAGQWKEQRASNMLDGGAHFYGTFRCSDGAHVAVGAIEPQFYATLCKLARLDEADFARQLDRARWPEMRDKLAAIFMTRTRQQWCDLLEGTDACVSPVLTMSESAQHPHLVHRGSLLDSDGALQAAPAPRFDRTPSRIQGPPADHATPVTTVLAQWLTRHSEE